MESMGYGDEMCPECGAIKWSESDGDFESRIWGEDRVKFWKEQEDVSDLSRCGQIEQSQRAFNP